MVGHPSTGRKVAVAASTTGAARASLAWYRLTVMAGRYDFGEWEMNLWAERLGRSGRTTDAVAVYQLNFEYFAESASILIALGQLLEPTDRAKALEYYRRALTLQPRNTELQRRIQALETPP